MSNLRLALALAAALCAGGAWLYWQGGQGHKAKAETAQMKKTEQVRKAHAKVKRDAPGNADKRVVVDWLRRRTVD